MEPVVGVVAPVDEVKEPEPNPDGAGGAANPNVPDTNNIHIFLLTKRKNECTTQPTEPATPMSAFLAVTRNPAGLLL